MLRMCWWIIAFIHPALRYPQLYTQRIVLSTTVGKKPEAIHNYPPCCVDTVLGVDWTLGRENDGCRRKTTLGLDAGQRERTSVAEE